MKHFFRAIVALSILVTSLHAQTWTPPAPFDTGWFNPADANCQPIVNEPTESSRPLGVPVPPPDAFMAQVGITTVEYRNTITATNVSLQAAYYRTRPTYSFRVGHVAGLFDFDGHLYAAGHGLEDATRFQAAAVSAGTGPAERNLDAGETTCEEFHTVYANVTTVEVTPVTPEWRAQRRGRHPLFVTAEGEYDWQVGFQGGPPLQGGQHWPISYQSQPEMRLTGWVRFAQPGP